MNKVGRKSWDKEAEMKELWDLSIPVLKRALGPNSKVSDERKIEISLHLVSKMFPRQPEVKVDIHNGYKIDIISIIKEVREHRGNGNNGAKNRISGQLPKLP